MTDTNGNVGNKATILLVEDDDPFRSTLERVLKLTGYNSLFAESYDAALEIVERLVEEKKSIDLVVADYYLQLKKGPELVGEMRRVYPDLKAIYMSGVDQCNIPSSPLSTVELADFLAKPFDPNILIRAIDNKLCEPEDHFIES